MIVNKIQFEGLLIIENHLYFPVDGRYESFSYPLATVTQEQRTNCSNKPSRVLDSTTDSDSDDDEFILYVDERGNKVYQQR